MCEVLQWTVSADEQNLRLDTFLTLRLAFLSRRAISRLIARGQVCVNGQKKKKGTRVRAGDVITAPVVQLLKTNADIPIEVVYVDDSIVVLNKPAGVPSVALHQDESETVANFLAARFPETVFAGPRPLEGGLVHRLDTTTSGLLVAARTPAAYTSLRQQFRAQVVEKTYLALVTGQFNLKGSVVFYLTPIGPRRQRMQLVGPKQGQEAFSTYVPLETLPGHTLTQVTITTGVRHQIRAHLAGIGHPIIGDTLYGSKEKVPRLCLHACMLAFAHPTTSHWLQFRNPLPQDFLSLVDQRRNRREPLERETSPAPEADEN